MPFVLVDTGVWYALCDRADGTVDRSVVRDIEKQIAVHTILLPWPIAYETLRSGFVRKRLALERFERELVSPRVERVDDAPYRKAALELSLDSSLRRKRPLSMVDCLMRIMIEDVRVNIRYLVTFNARDFVDVCTKRQVELWPG